MIRERATIGILGAGRLGIVLARLAARAGYRVVIAGSGDPGRVALPADLLGGVAVAGSIDEVATGTDIVILALPLGKYREIPPPALDGRLVIDAMNYWWEADGFPSEFTDPLTTSSELVQDHLRGSRVVKALNHMGYRDLGDEARASGQPGRKAIGLAGDRAADLQTVAGLIDDLGFDPVTVGALVDGVTLEPGTEPFGADVGAEELREMVARFPQSQRGLRRAAAVAARHSAASGN